MSIAFWGDKESAGLELVSVHQFIELLGKKESRNEIGHREGINIIIDAITRNKFKKTAHLNILSTDYVEPIDITDTIAPSEKDEYSRISQLLKGKTKKLECYLDMPSKTLLEQMKKKKLEYQDIPFISFEIGPFEEGRQLFRSYLHVKDVEHRRKDSRDSLFYVFYGMKSTASLISETIDFGYQFKRNWSISKSQIFDNFKEYYYSNIDGQIIFPNTSTITVIARNATKSCDWVNRIFAGGQKPIITNPSYFTYNDYSTSDLTINLSVPTGAT